MQGKRFLTNDEGFVCANCGLDVLPLGSSSRNHCPRCLYSRHVDVHPGDRACACRGMMRPVAIETEGRRGYVIVHRCERCGELRRNGAAMDSPTQPDSMESIVALSASAAPSKRASRSRRP